MIDKQIFTKDSIFIDQNFSSKEEAFRFLSQKFFEMKFCSNKEDVYNGFIERENEGSTAFTDGIGIPHSKVDSITKPDVMIIKNKNGIDWDSLDGKPTFFLISLAIPNIKNDVTHLKMLSSIPRKLVDNSFKTSLLASTTIEEIYSLISQVEII